MKILKMLARMGTLNISVIAKRLSLNYSSTNEHIQLLEREGILMERTYGRIRMIKYNEASTKARAVQNLIEAWEQAK